MTGRTHDLTAFTALVLITAYVPNQNLTLATALVSIGANLIGGLAPDIDQPTSDLWQKVPVGSVFGRIVHPFLGGHRYISHSLLGVFLFGFIARYILMLINPVLIVDMNYVWLAFMIGYVSHLVIDTITREGVPWLFPVPIRFGIPPFKALRIKTGGMIEKGVVFPGLLVLNIYIFYSHYSKFIDLLKLHIKY